MRDYEAMAEEEALREMLDEVTHYANNKRLEEENKVQQHEAPPGLKQWGTYGMNLGKGWNSAEEWEQHVNWLSTMWEEAWKNEEKEVEAGGEVDALGKGKGGTSCSGSCSEGSA